MHTKTLTGSSPSIAELGLRDDHPLSSARRLGKSLATKAAIFIVVGLAAVALGSVMTGLIVLVVAGVLGAIVGGVAVVRYRNGLDMLILDGRSPGGVPGLGTRLGYLTSRRLRHALARSLRSRPWVRDSRILDAYATLARRLESPEPISARGMLRLIALLQTAPSAVAVGSPDAVMRELGAITYLLEIRTTPLNQGGAG